MVYEHLSSKSWEYYHPIPPKYSILLSQIQFIFHFLLMNVNAKELWGKYRGAKSWFSLCYDVWKTLLNWMTWDSIVAVLRTLDWEHSQQSFGFWNSVMPRQQKFHNFGTCIPSLLQQMELNFNHPIKIFIMDPLYNTQPIFLII